MSGPAGALFPATRLFLITTWLALLVVTIPDTTATLAAGIAIDGAKDHLHLGIGTIVEDATTWPLSPIIRDRTVDQRECPSIVGDATTGISQIPRDRAVDQGQRSTRRVVDAATTRISTNFPRPCC